MGCAGLFNLTSLVLGIIACIGGLSTDPGALKAAPWVTGQGDICFNATCMEINTYMGISARHDTIDLQGNVDKVEFLEGLNSQGFTLEEETIYSRTIPWSDDRSCGEAGDETVEMCQDCRDNLLSTTTLYIGVFSQLPTMATNCQRSTPFGDVNCQASLGVLSNLLGFASAYAAYQAYSTACYTAMPSTINGQPWEWKMGLGLHCLLATIFIKLFDAGLHGVLRTPPARWQSPGKDVTDVTEYLMLAVAPGQQKMQSDVVGNQT